MRSTSCTGSLITGIFFALMLFVLPVAAEIVEAGSISISSPVHDFGTVSEGTKVTHDFTIKNAGTAELQIQRVVPSCGCTVSNVEPDKISAGGTATLHVEFDSTGFSGEKSKLVRIYSSDVKQPATQVTLKGVVNREISVEPARVVLSTIVKGNPMPAPVEAVVRVAQGSKTKITGVQSFNKNLRVQVLEANPQKYRISISLSPDLPVGEFRERVIVNLSDGGREALNIPVYASVQGQLRLEPSAVSFGIIQGKEVLERSVKLENRGAEPLKIEKLSSDTPAVNVSSTTIEDGKIYVVRVRVDPAQVEKEIRAAVTIQTNRKDESALVLNVYGTRPPRG